MNASTGAVTMPASRSQWNARNSRAVCCRKAAEWTAVPSSNDRVPGPLEQHRGQEVTENKGDQAAQQPQASCPHTPSQQHRPDPRGHNQRTQRRKEVAWAADDRERLCGFKRVWNVVEDVGIDDQRLEQQAAEQGQQRPDVRQPDNECEPFSLHGRSSQAP
jgi:hypothetical protein